MAPSVSTWLAKRYYCSDWDNDGDCDRSGWYWWGRWVLLGIIVFALFCIFLSMACIARRRRRHGIAPMYGTGWMAPNSWDNKHPNNVQPGFEMNNQYGGQQSYGGQQPYGGQQSYFNGGNPPPAYGPQSQQQPQYTGTTFNPNDGYYGAQSPQSPPHVYQGDTGGRNVYSPPPGSPPSKVH